MNRILYQALLEWKGQINRLPLLVRGARQVGKSYLIEQFGRENYDQLIKVNFELQPQVAQCFEQLDPHMIIKRLELFLQVDITPHRTLLFLDEIQECPTAISALRYLYEQYPDIHVIGAGSLLEFVLNDASFRMPVGRVQFMYLAPLSFQEFMMAMGEEKALKALSSCTPLDPLPLVIHDRLMLRVKEYMLIGGMPAAVNAFLVDHRYRGVDPVQVSILNTYRSDFGKYASKSSVKLLQKVFDRAPSITARRFKYVDIDRDLLSRDIKQAIELLVDARILRKVRRTNAAGIPLSQGASDNDYKLLFMDIGLMIQSLHVQSEIDSAKDVTLVHQGSVAEQWVGQQLLLLEDWYRDAELFYWQRESPGSTAEVDYVVALDGQIIPIEVKSGTTGRLRSIQQFMKEKQSPMGVRISAHPLSYVGQLLSVPFYMVHELPRLVDALKHHVLEVHDVSEGEHAEDSVFVVNDRDSPKAVT